MQHEPHAFGATLITRSKMWRENSRPGSRMNLIRHKEHKKKNASQLLYHTQCIELLVSCVQGKNCGTEARLRSIFSWEDCVANVLDLGKYYAWDQEGAQARGIERDIEDQLDQDVLRRVKAPFVRLLTQLFLNAEGNQSELGQETTRFPRWWEDDEPAVSDWQTAPSCLMDEFITEIELFTLRLNRAEVTGKLDAEAEVI